MAGMGAGYDLSVSTFSPDGRVFQVEYAMKAVEGSGLCLASVCSDGILFAVEKVKPSPLLLPTTNRRIYPITPSIGMLVAGLAADGRQIVSRARSEADDYRRIFGVEIPAGVLAERIGLFIHVYTLYWSVRPFGSGIILGSVSDGGDSTGIDFSGELFCIDPSGCCSKFVGTALGKGSLSAKTELEKIFKNNMGSAGNASVTPTPKQTTKEALVTFMKIFLTVDEEGRREGSKRVEVEAGVIGKWDGKDSRRPADGLFGLISKEEVEEAEKRAQQLLDEMDED